MPPAPTTSMHPAAAPAGAESAARERLQRAAGADYEVGELIGRGGYADVFRALDRRLGRPVALKVPRPEFHGAPDALERFAREARSIAALRHPHILPIHSIAGDDDVVFLVLALIDGDSLERRLEREPRMDVDAAARLLGEIASALEAAHGAGIVHRDIKPANVLLDGPEDRALLTDFGIARAMGGAELGLTRAGTFVGSPHYMSPEQAAGDEADHRADLYSLGVLGYRMLTGDVPFDGPIGSVLVQHLTKPARPIRELRHDCPDWLADALHRCLAKSPEERWSSSAELGSALAGRSGGGTRPTRADAGSGADDRADVDPATRLRRRVATVVGVAIGSLGLDLVLTGSVTASALVLLIAAGAIAMSAAAAWTAGHDPVALLRGRRRALDPSTEEFGRHAGAVRRARATRTDIVRALGALSNLERSRVRAIPPAADGLVGHVTRLARRLGALDARIGAERARGSGRDVAGRTRIVGEMIGSRARVDAELAEAEAALDRLAEATQRLVGSGAEAFRPALDAALVEAARCVRGAADEDRSAQPI